MGPGLSGWSVNNAVPAANYLGNGGTHSVPDAAYVASGIWQRSMEMQAGEQSVFTVHCNSHGCGKWNSGYNLFELDATSSVDTVSYQPQTSTLEMTTARHWLPVQSAGVYGGNHQCRNGKCDAH